MKKSLAQLQAHDFQKWMRKQVREFGRRAEIASIEYSAVEVWLKELGYDQVVFLSGGEIVIGATLHSSAWQTIGYYMFDEEGLMEVKAGRWLDIAEMEEPGEYLITKGCEI